jgi:hypothetical protein
MTVVMNIMGKLDNTYAYQLRIGVKCVQAGRQHDGGWRVD